MKIKRTINIMTVLIMLFGMLLAAGPALAQDPAPAAPGSILIVKKTAVGTWGTNWSWTIDKTGDQTDLTLSTGQTFLVNYTVTVTPSGVTQWTVTGAIDFVNNSASDAVITSVQDVLSDGTVANVTCPFSFPYTLPAGFIVTGCTYTASGTGAVPASNTATVYLQGDVVGGSDTVAVTDGGSSEIDECIMVSDDQFGDLGMVCADGGEVTFHYTLPVGPYDVCGMYEFVNIASFITTDTKTTGWDSWKVKVNIPCDEGCTLTPGYWKTHSEFGPAPYDNTWALLGPLGASTPFYLSGKTYYQVLWTPPSGGNAYYILAHAYIAAQLNLLNGASSTAEVDAALAWAHNFFNTYTPSSQLSKTLRGMALTYATLLDMYNNGYVGPGHCSE